MSFKLDEAETKYHATVTSRPVVGKSREICCKYEASKNSVRSQAALQTVFLGRKLRAPRLPPKSMTVSWERVKRTEHTSALEAHIEGFIQVEELQLPKTGEP